MGFSAHIRIVICYIESHIKDQPTDYGEMEKITGFSAAYLRELFKKQTGCSLAKFIRNRKLNSSAFELLHSKMTIMEIALMYGFSCHESYSRAFRKLTGMTPSRFRKERPVIGKNRIDDWRVWNRVS